MSARVELTAASVATAMSGALLSGSPSAPIGDVSIDSRTLRPGSLFVAISGERFDGHRFVGEALGSGACGVVVSERSAVPPAATQTAIVIHVADTTRALQTLSQSVRRRSGAKVVAVTGSAGKTTTKEVAAELLATRYRVFRTKGNFNNHIGLPLSLLELRDGPDIAVVELGMNHAGEIRMLVGLAEPDVRVWTNVAEVHAAYFSSIEAIADAKAEILDGATSDTVVVANAADARVMARVGGCAARIVTFGVEVDADVSASGVVDAGIGGTTATVSTPAGRAEFRVPLVGRGHLSNVLAATAVALQFGVPIDDIAARVSGLTPAPRRGEVWRLRDGVVLVDDSYNSNPVALRRMLDVLGAGDLGRRRVAVLGEMLELGAQSVAWHRACGAAAARAGVSVLVAVGGLAARAMATAATEAGMDPAAVLHVETSEEAAAHVVHLLRAGDLVLVKGSRAIRTDLVADRVKAERA